MRIEHLYEFIVPLIFVAIWAVTWILNREAQPLPPRPIRREQDELLGPDASAPREPLRDIRGSGPWTAATPDPVLFSPRADRSMPPAFQRSADRESILGPGDAIVFTEPPAGRPLGSPEKPAGQRPRRGPQSRRGARAKGAGGAKSQPRAVAERPRELTQEVSNSLARLKGRPLELTPLNLPLSPLTSLPLAQSGFTSASSESLPPEVSRSTPSLPDLRKSVSDPAKLREIFVFNELMQPPLALRNASRYRR